ncbi:hypothetical protein MKW98_005174, partial [Papaver atlanticum]
MANYTHILNLETAEIEKVAFKEEENSYENTISLLDLTDKLQVKDNKTPHTTAEQRLFDWLRVRIGTVLHGCNTCHTKIECVNNNLTCAKCSYGFKGVTVP